MFGKLFGKGKAAVKQFTNRDLLQGSIAAGVLVAFADGDCSDNEVDTLLTMLEANPALGAFSSEIPAVLEDYCRQMNVSARAGKRNLMKEIRDCTEDKEEAEQILIVALDVADADGEVTPEEQALLENIATSLGLRVADYA
jgi:tellurite resistance protein TerB